MRDYIVTLPWTRYHGFQNTRDYGPKPEIFAILYSFYKKEGASLGSPYAAL